MRVLKRAVLLSGVALAGIASHASAATTVGEAFLPDQPEQADGCFVISGGTYLQAASPGDQYRVPSSGVITSWSYQAGSAPWIQMQLKLATEMAGTFFIEAESNIEQPAANAVNTFNTQIPVNGGELLGFWGISQDSPVGADCWRFPPADYEVFFASPNLGPNQTGSWIQIPGQGSGIQMDVAATVEPDADQDGFGDESQDTCLPPTVRTDCDRPQTTITDAPREKTKNRKPTFEFTSDERRSTFECRFGPNRRFDRSRYRACESPFRKRLEPGRNYTFKVRAVDRGGNVDRSPATSKFRLRPS